MSPLHVERHTVARNNCAVFIYSCVRQVRSPRHGLADCSILRTSGRHDPRELWTDGVGGLQYTAVEARPCRTRAELGSIPRMRRPFRSRVDMKRREIVLPLPTAPPAECASRSDGTFDAPWPVLHPSGPWARRPKEEGSSPPHWRWTLRFESFDRPVKTARAQQPNTERAHFIHTFHALSRGFEAHAASSCIAICQRHAAAQHRYDARTPSPLQNVHESIAAACHTSTASSRRMSPTITGTAVRGPYSASRCMPPPRSRR